jgi:hypothetical protein
MGQGVKKPQAIRSILESSLKNLEIDPHLRAYSIWSAWEEIVGSSVALHTQPRAIRNRILFVDVSHPTWIQQLQFLKTMLLEKINGYLGESMIQDIRFRLGKISPHPVSSSKEEAWQKEKLDENTSKHIENLLRTIRDEEARNTLRELLIKGAKLERYRRNRD